MAYWLFKSEPDVFSFDDLVKKGSKGEEWTGIRNYQARNNMRLMKLGEQGFFYHSAFVPGVVVVRVLPPLTDSEGHSAATKRLNLLPPPGVDSVALKYRVGDFLQALNS